MILVGRYIEDLSKTSITYKHYNENPEDQYPTYSICFKGTSLYWNNDLAIFNEYELHPDQFEQILKGENAFRYHYNATSRLYKKLPTFFRNVLNRSFGAFHLQISDILDKAIFTADDGDNSILYDKFSNSNSSHDPPFYIGYQTPEMICFTRESKYGPNTTWLEDELSFNEKLLKDTSILHPKTNFSIYIHYPNHLIRSLASPNFKSSLKKYADLIEPTNGTSRFLEFRLSQGTVLRKRSDATGSCRSEIVDYDRYLLEIVCKDPNISCIPPYWKDKLQNISGLPECTQQIQLKGVYDSTTSKKQIIAKHSVPCTDMYNSIVSKWQRKEAGDPWMLLKFLYEDQYYIEIKYWQDFGFENFVSNLGGFIGIFLGYSMMQLPELIGKNCVFL